MSSRRAAPRLGATLVALAMLSGSTLALSPGSPAVAAPTYGVDERAQAIASPSLLFLESTYTGVIRDKKSGEPLQSDPMVVYRRCSGMIISPEGYALTTSLCVQPSHDIVRQAAFYKLGRNRIAQRKLDADKLDSFVKGLMSTADFTGPRPGTKPGLTIFGQLNVATAGRTSDPAIPVTVVGGQDPAEGNVAVVKLDQAGLPAVELEPEANLGHGSTVVILGFDTKDSDANIGTYTVQAKTVDVTAVDGADRLKTSEDVGPYSHGGMALNSSGRVVAMLDADASTAERPNRALIGMAALSAAQADHDVSNQLSDVDRAYRAGLDAYFAGRYSTAVREFDKVLAQSPSHLLANIYRQNASDRYAVEGDAIENSANWPMYLLSAAGGALVILLITLGWRLVTWRRRAADPNLLAPVSTSPYPPVSGAGAYPVSGAGGYPVSGGGAYSVSGPPAPAAPPGPPRPPAGPLPPVQVPPAQDPATPPAAYPDPSVAEQPPSAEPPPPPPR